MLELIDLFGKLWLSISDATPQALVKALFVLLAIIVLRFVKVLPDSKWARATNVVMSVLLSGVLTGGANQQEVAVMTLTATFAAGVWDLLAALYVAKSGRAKPFSPPVG